MSGPASFPFPAVIGQDEAKRALLAALVSDGIRTVLVQGTTGSAKTTLIRSLAGISDCGIINIPVGTNGDQIFGSLDVEETLLKGKRAAMPGLLERADGNILYADDVNLMDDTLLDQLLESVMRGKASIEEEGISREYKCRTLFIGTMNPSDGGMCAHLLDRFQICIEITASQDEGTRYEIVRSRVEYDSDPDTFVAGYEKECSELRDTISRARDRLPYVSVPDDILNIIAELCIKAGSEGLRGDLALTEVSRALAALGGRDVVELDDVREAARMCLRHRMTRTPEDDSPSGGPDDGSSGSEPPPMSPDDGRGSGGKEDRNDRSGEGGSDEDTVFGVGNTFSVIDFVSLKPLGFMGSSKGGGKHERIISSDRTGRYIRAEIPKGDVRDLAFDASIRVAAPYQRYRDRGDLALVLERSDLREKVRERKKGVSIMFVVDASGSMGARKRMVAVKGAVFSLLQESYKNRDKVGLISFRKDRAEILLPFTKSVDFAYKKLKEMPTGGTTPLAAAMLKAYMEVKKEERMNPGERCYIVLATDGRANVSISGGDALQDSMRIASTVGRDDSAVWIVVDTGTGYPHLDNALRLSERLSGIYLRLEDLRADSLAHRIKTIVGNRAV